VLPNTLASVLQNLNKWRIKFLFRFHQGSINKLVHYKSIGIFCLSSVDFLTPLTGMQLWKRGPSVWRYPSPYNQFPTTSGFDGKLAVFFFSFRPFLLWLTATGEARCYIGFAYCVGSAHSTPHCAWRLLTLFNFACITFHFVQLCRRSGRMLPHQHCMMQAGVTFHYVFGNDGWTCGT